MPLGGSQVPELLAQNGSSRLCCGTELALGRGCTSDRMATSSTGAWGRAWRARDIREPALPARGLLTEAIEPAPHGDLGARTLGLTRDVILPSASPTGTPPLPPLPSRFSCRCPGQHDPLKMPWRPDVTCLLVTGPPGPTDWSSLTLLLCLKQAFRHLAGGKRFCCCCCRC